MEPGIAQCRQAALRILEHRWNSAAELRRKLIRRGFSTEDIDSVVNALTVEGWLDDSRFAAALVRKRAARLKGPRAIQRELEAAGVSDPSIRRGALDEVLTEEQMTASLERLAAKKRASLEQRYGVGFVETDAGRNKLRAYLFNQGYDGAAVQRVVSEPSGE